MSLAKGEEGQHQMKEPRSEYFSCLHIHMHLCAHVCISHVCKCNQSLWFMFWITKQPHHMAYKLSDVGFKSDQKSPNHLIHQYIWNRTLLFVLYFIIVACHIVQFTFEYSRWA